MTSDARDEINRIMKVFRLRRISAFRDGDNSRITLVPEGRLFDAHEYYIRNRERIREYQSRYYALNSQKIRERLKRNYLRRKDGSTTMKQRKAEARIMNSPVTHKELAMAMRNILLSKGMDVRAEDLMDSVCGIMGYFGYYNEITENHLEDGDRQVMYQLEDMGLMRTRSEKYILPSGKEWRAFYFVLNTEKIKKYAGAVNAPDEYGDIYSQLPEEAWVR